MKPGYLIAGIISIVTGIWLALTTLQIIPDLFPGDKVSVFRWPIIFFMWSMGGVYLWITKITTEESK